jgi:NitT/TauT family transport system ATP-binding protein/sulfonate transport system ATP-binding protein
LAYLEAVGLTKTFEAEEGAPTVAVDGFTLAMAEGEFVALLGPSGCGKSTVLNIVAGFLRPSAGHVLVDGRTVTVPGADRGVVFQEHALFPWMRVLDNVAFGLRLRGVPRRERLEIGQRFVDLVGLTGFERHWPRQLSGGMKQRVAIARALANDPKVLLMDEPFGALDAQNRRMMQDELVKIWAATKKTCLFVTHSIEEALLLSDRVVTMTTRPGRIKAVHEVGLTRPRDDAAPLFQTLKRQLAELLQQELPKEAGRVAGTGSEPQRP